jgi:hypothetical protein
VLTAFWTLLQLNKISYLREELPIIEEKKGMQIQMQGYKFYSPLLCRFCLVSPQGKGRL